MCQYKITHIAVVMVLLLVQNVSYAGRFLDVVNPVLSFSEHIVTADGCSNIEEKVSGAIVSELPLLLGAAIGVPVGLMSGSLSTGLKWGGIISGLTGAAQASAGIIQKKKLDDAAGEPQSLFRKRQVALCKIIKDRKSQLGVLLENLRSELIPPCIHVIVNNQDVRNDVEKADSFLEQMDYCSGKNPELRPYFLETIRRIEQLNLQTCNRAVDQIKFYNKKMMDKAISDHTSFIQMPEQPCTRDRDYELYEVAQ